MPYFQRKRAIPLVITFHNYVLDRWMRQYSSLAQKIHYATDLKLWTYLAIKRASALTAVSRFTAGIVKKDMGVDSPVRVIYNGIDGELFRPSPLKKPRRKEIAVLFSGNLTRRKGGPLASGYFGKTGSACSHILYKGITEPSCPSCIGQASIHRLCALCCHA